MVANNVDVDKNQILHQHQIKQGTIVAHLSLPLRFTYVSAKELHNRSFSSHHTQECARMPRFRSCENMA